MKYFSLQALLDRLFDDGWCSHLVPDVAPLPLGLDDELLAANLAGSPCEP